MAQHAALAQLADRLGLRALQLRQNRRPLAETLQEIADHVLPGFHRAA
jgi:hypothetical protein